MSLSSGNEKNQFYLSYANTSGRGIVEKNTLQKNNIYLKANSKLYENVSVEGSANFIVQKVDNRPYTGFESNPALEAYLYPGSKSAFGALKDNYQVWNQDRQINVQNYPYSGYNSGSYILDNPYWTINKNPNFLKRFRSVFTGSLKWDITKTLNFQTRLSYDKVDDQFEQHVYATSSPIVYDQAGEYYAVRNTNSQMYADFMLSFNKNDLGNFSLSAVLGNSNNYYDGYTQLINTLNLPTSDNFRAVNVFSLTNLQGKFDHIETSVRTLNQSIFGTATLGYNDMLFFDVTARNEWSSTIADESFFYPSVGGTLILSKLTGTNDFFSFMKLRATYSEVGNALPYGVNVLGSRIPWTGANGIINNPLNGLVMREDGSFIELKPERSKSFEIGTNVKLLSSNVDLDVTYYSNTVENQYFPVAAPLGAYVPNYYVNAGEVKNTGIEATLSFKLASGDFKYATAFNFAHNKSEIVSVSEEGDIESYTLTQYANTKIAEIRMVKGGEFGDIYAPTFARNDDGSIQTNADNGAPVATGEYIKVGNPNSPVTLGWSNTFNYKGLSFNFLIDGRIGGDIISLTESNLDALGRSQRTADARDAGSVVFEGQTVAAGNAAIQAWYQGLAGIGSNYVYSATNFRVREISLGYNIPVDFSNGIFKNLYVSVYGKNLFFLYKDAPFDPEVSAATSTGLQGIEAFSLPSTRSFGFSLKANF
ncbi:MAG: TonB-dependent receptor [Chloroflexia bacterium]|nr:TonB-dependent receptor [Chloroflexia bacterium]